MLKPEKFDIETIEPSDITDPEWSGCFSNKTLGSGFGNSAAGLPFLVFFSTRSRIFESNWVARFNNEKSGSFQKKDFRSG